MRTNRRSVVRSEVAAISMIFFLVLIAVMTAVTVRAAQVKPLDILFDSADTNHDGIISESEWHNAMQQYFIKMDMDGDGKVSRAEMEKTRETMRERLKNVRNAQRGTF